ncbi:C40 family peptidase [Streptomyces odonnellii]|uniref:C40 family peptidase n=1 Tax=Streptomyces odonnellii TaxID=1417980 RepID=UPI0006990194|nr:bifunctional lytic transglycosylase/C40 family peptidase [Streptomyces odonnellii]
MKRAHWIGIGLLVTCPVVLLSMLAFLTYASALAADSEEDEEQAWGEQVPASVAGIPAVMLSAYSSAAARTPEIRPRCTGMRWQILAGIGAIESGHAQGRTVSASGDITPRIIGVPLNGSGLGENTSVHNDTDSGRLDGDASYDRAVGPMQFIPATWSSSGRDGNSDQVKDPHNAFDATLAAAGYLCGGGTRDLTDPAQLKRAILSYNRSEAYYRKVLARIHEYDQAASSPPAAGSARAQAVINAALSQLGKPYVWGGGNFRGPTGGGFDCSGLTQYALYQGTGGQVKLPRTSQTQRGTGLPVTKDQMQPGDIIVINNDGNWGHVGLYLGGDQMVHAPRSGKNVEITSIRGYWERYPWDVRRVVSAAG